MSLIELRKELREVFDNGQSIGWDGYDASVISVETYGTALAFAGMIREKDWEILNVCGTALGGINFDFYKGKRNFLSVDILGDKIDNFFWVKEAADEH